MQRINRSLIAVATLLTLAGCGSAPEGTSDNPVQASAPESLPMSTITGSVSYRERMALTPTATLNLQLQDVSLADAAAEIIAERTISSANGETAYLQLTTENEAVQGFSGCNRFNGSWSREEGRIVLGAMAMTMMACASEMDTEQAFMQALEEQNRHQIVGNELSMYRDDELVLLFKATN